MSSDGEQPHEDLFVVLQHVFRTDVSNDGQNHRDVDVVSSQDGGVVTAGRDGRPVASLYPRSQALSCFISLPREKNS